MEALGYLHAERAYQQTLATGEGPQLRGWGLLQALSLLPLGLGVALSATDAQAQAVPCQTEASCQAQAALRTGNQLPLPVFRVFRPGCSAASDDAASPSPAATPFLATTVTAPLSEFRLGSSGVEVARLQAALQRLGYYQGALDGLYGPQTRQAVAAFQQTQALQVDGIVGPQTLALL